MATINSLPDELLGDIMGYLLVLREAALVCRRWREPAQRALFSHVVLSSKDRTRKWLDSSARPRYRTRSMKLCWSSKELQPRVIAACPDLVSLYINTRVAQFGGCEWCIGVGLPQGLNRLKILFPEDLPGGTTPLEVSSLRHLEVFVDGGDRQNLEPTILQAILIPSSKTLTSISFVYLELGVIADRLLEVFAATRFPLVQHLSLERSTAFEIYPELLGSFPSLVSLELIDQDMWDPNLEDSIVAVGASIPRTIQTLTLTGFMASEYALEDLLTAILLPNLDGLRQLEILMVSKDELASETGLALLDECERRSISLRCRYGFLTRDMMEDVLHVDGFERV